uniref:RNA-directed RNA polymerase n=1 Tax=Reticulitermes speratus dicistrovirus TaxID=3032235 RepID=A0AAT9JFZ2_9VIRU
MEFEKPGMSVCENVNSFSFSPASLKTICVRSLLDCNQMGSEDILDVYEFIDDDIARHVAYAVGDDPHFSDPERLDVETRLFEQFGTVWNPYLAIFVRNKQFELIDNMDDPYLSVLGRRLWFAQGKKRWLKRLRDLLKCSVARMRFPIYVQVEGWFYDQLRSSGILNKIECTFALEQLLLLLAGDVEENPGPPVFSVYSLGRNNDPSPRRDIDNCWKYHHLIRGIRQISTNQEVHAWAQVFGMKDLCSQLPTFNTQVTRIADFLETTLPTLQAGFVSTQLGVVSGLDKIKEDLVKVVVIVLLCKIFVQCQMYRTAIMAILVFLAIYYGLPAKLISLVKQLCDPQTQVNTEDIIYSNQFVLVGKVMFAFLAFICIRQIPGRKDWDNFLLRLDRIPKGIKGTGQIFDFTSQCFNLCHDQLKMIVLGKTKEELYQAHDIYGRIDQWAKDVRTYLDLSERDKIDTNPEIAVKVEKLYRDGLGFMAETNLDMKASRMVASTLVAAKQLHEYVSCSPVKGGGPRMRPVCVWLIGESGIGKTEMVYPLCIDVLRTMGLVSPKDFHHQVYARQVETEYWDGYKNQKIVIYDDAFQMKDDKTKPNPELFEVIRSCNTFPQHLHMAALHDKNTFSAAELLLYTTNLPDVKIESLTFPEAFHNRMNDNAYVVRPRPEYLKTVKYPGQADKIMLDLEKLDKDKAIDLNVYEFQKVVYDARESDNHWTDIGEPIRYEEFSRLICETWKNAKNRSRDKLKFLEQYAMRVETQAGEEEFSDCASTDLVKQVEDIMAETLCRGGDIDEVVSWISHDEQLFRAYLVWRETRKPVSRWRKYKDRLDVLYEDYKQWLNGLLEKGRSVIQEHPVLSALGIVGLVATVVGIYSYFTSDSEEKEKSWSGRIVDKVKNLVGESTIEGLIPVEDCPICSDPSNQGFQPDECMDLHDWESFYAREKRTMAEVGTSGDSKTTKLQRVRVEVGQSGDQKTQKLQRIQVEVGPSVKTVERAFVEKVRAQACGDENANTLVVGTLRSNTYRMSFLSGGQRVQFGNVTFLRGWTAMMPYHFLTSLQARKCSPSSILYLSQDGKPDIIQFPVSHLFYIDEDQKLHLTENVVQVLLPSGETEDCVVFNLHGQICHLHKDILKHFVKKEDQASLIGKNTGAFATFQTEEPVGIVRAYQWLRDIQPVDGVVRIHHPMDGYHYPERSFMQREMYEYSAPTQRGDCGSIVTIHDKRIVRKMIGMHVAGASDKGFACPLTQERLVEAMSKLQITTQVYYEPSDMIIDEEPKVPDGNFVPLGKSREAIGQAVATSLKPSRISGLIKEPITAPACLKPIKVGEEIVDPLLKGLKKCGVVTPVLPMHWLDACVNDVRRIALTQYNESISRHKYERFLTFEEAVIGADDDFMVSINRTTSPGFPYTLHKEGKPGKMKWFGTGENFDLENDNAKQIKIDVEQLLSNCSKGIISNVYCVDTLKDERRELAKVAVGKTRVFSACPQHFVIAFRMYFLPFAAWLMHNRISNEIAVGTNVYSYDWDRIARRLKRHGNRVIAGDFSNYDGTLNPSVLWAIFHSIYVPWLRSHNGSNGTLDDTTYKTILGLWTHIVHSVHVFDNNVYMWTHSQPSGNPFTVIINSLYNSIIMRMAWMEVMYGKQPKMATMRCFNENVTMISYGDDNVLNISNGALEYYNQDTIADALEKMGHIYTDEGKSGEVIESRKLSEVLFLKRRFDYSVDLQRYIAPLRKDVIYEMLNWTRRTSNPDEILMQNIETAAREMALHSREDFEAFGRAIQMVSDKLPRLPMILTRGEYMHQLRVDAENYL